MIQVQSYTTTGGTILPACAICGKHRLQDRWTAKKLASDNKYFEKFAWICAKCSQGEAPQQPTATAPEPATAAPAPAPTATAPQRQQPTATAPQRQQPTATATRQQQQTAHSNDTLDKFFPKLTADERLRVHAYASATIDYLKIKRP